MPLFPEPAGQAPGFPNAAYQELLNGGDQDIVEGDVRQLPGLLTVILRHIGDEQAALSVVAHHHAILVANRRFMHEAMAKAQRLEAPLKDAERRVQELEHAVALLKDAPTPRGTLAAFADQLKAFAANALTRLNAVRFHEDVDERRLAIAAGLIAYVTAVKILVRDIMAKMGHI